MFIVYFFNFKNRYNNVLIIKLFEIIDNLKVVILKKNNSFCIEECGLFLEYLGNVDFNNRLL